MRFKLVFIITAVIWTATCFFYTSYAKTVIEVRGVVVDEQQLPLPGVTVMVKGENTGVITGEDGRFAIRVPDNGSVLVFSSIGFSEKEVPVGDQRELEVVLLADQNQLDEVVVIGYGENLRKHITTAISSLDASDVAPRNVSSASQLLQGQLAGVNMTLSNGTPGGASRVSIRGVSSINGDNEPLYVIDGVPLSKSQASYNFTGEYRQDPLSMINPSDIASIDVLKDAAAAAIYGNRASNGVVLITTKEGKKGASSITVSQLSGAQVMPKKLNLMNPEQYIALQKEAVDNYNRDMNLQPGSPGYIDIAKVLGNVPADPYDVKWQDLIIKDPAGTHQTDLSFSGAGDLVNHFTSAGYYYQQGLLINSSLKRYSVRSNIDFTPGKVFNFGVRLGGNYTRSTSAPNGAQGTALFQRSLEQRPYDRPYKEDGSYNIGGKDILRHNGIQVLENDEIYDKNYQALINLYGNLKLLKYLTLHSSYNTEIRSGQGFRHQTRMHPYAFGKGLTIDIRNTRTAQNLDNTLTFDRSWSNELHLQAMAGHSFFKDTYQFNEATGTEFPSDDFKHITSATVTTADGDRSVYAIESYIGRLLLDYKDRYFISSTVRRDGSSKFDKEKRYATFPSVSAGWVFSDEAFAGSLNWLEFGKLRLSWGETGNQDGIGNYSYQELAEGGQNYDSGTGLSVRSLGNPDLKWETSTQTDIGLDLSFLKGRLNVTYDYFVKNTDDLLYNVPTLATSGFTSRSMNIGSMQNKGHELTISSANMDREGFQWTSSFNIAFIRNRVTSLIGEEPILAGGWNAIIVGQPLGIFYGYQQEGIYQELAEVPETLQQEGVRPGDMKYTDLDNNGIINSADMMIIGNSLPDFSGGMTHDFRLGNFDVSLFTTFSSGNSIAAQWRSGLDHMGALDYNALLDSYAERWTGPGTSNSVPHATKSGFNRKNSSYFIEDASYLRLKNLTVGYQLPETILGRAGISRLRLFLSCVNLLTFTGYSGYDPEASSTLDAKQFGVDNLVTPQPRTFMMGLNMSFN